jgi:hypothetical protein
MPKANFSDAIDKILEIKRKYGRINNIIVDSANPEMITSLKIQFNEPYQDQDIRTKVSWCKEHNQYLETLCLWFLNLL